MPQRKDILFESVDDKQQVDPQRPKTITVTIKVRDLLISFLILFALALGLLGWISQYVQQYTQFTKIANAQSDTNLPDLNDTNSGILAVVGADGADLYETPSGNTLGSLTIGSTLTAMGRSSDNLWIVVVTKNGATGWVVADSLVLFGLEELPVMFGDAPIMQVPDSSETNPTATATIPVVLTPTSTPTDTPTPIPTPTSTPRPAPTPTEVIIQPVTVLAVVHGTGAEIVDTPGGTSLVSSPANRRPTPENLDGLPVGRVAISGSRLNIRSGPGTNYAIIGKALPDEEFVVLGRNTDGTWVQLQVPDITEGFGWVSVSYFELNSSTISDLPLSNETSTAPVSTPTPSSNDGTISDGASSSALPNQSAGAPLAASAGFRTSPAAGLSGTLVFQESLGGNIYAYNLVTGALQWLTTGMDPAISPNSSQVSFTRFGADGGLYVINIDGSGERRIYASGSGPRSPSWSPDGQTIAFTYVSGEYICKDTGIGICLKRNRVISNLPDKVKEERNLSVIDLNGENFRDLPALNTARAPDWHPGGIVYQATTSLEITGDKHDDETRKIINEVVGYADPDWQPNGGRIVYQVNQGSHWEIFAINTDGTGEIPLTRPFTTLVDELPSNVSPAWSPTGQHIAFVSNRAPDHEAGPWRLWVMNGDGTDQHQLPIDLELTYQFNLEQMVSWGP